MQRECEKRGVKPFLVTGVLALTTTAHLPAQIFSLVPSADAFLSSANATSNFGGGGAVAVSAAGLPKGEFDSLLRFDLAAAKASFDALWGAGLWEVQSISLTLTANPPNNPIYNGNGTGPSGTNVNTTGLFTLDWLANDTWVEGAGTPASPGTTGVTFADLASLIGSSDETLGTFSFNGSNTGSTAYQLALTPAFTADLKGGNLVSFLAEPADANVAMVANSRTGAIFSRPTLTIVAVPEPATAALAFSGLMVLAGRRRRP